MSEINTQVEVRSGTATAWADADATDGDAAAVLGAGELGVDTTNGQIGIGDGSTAFPSLLTKFRANRVGTTTLVAGTKVVSDTHVTANSIILLAVKSLGTVTAPKALAVTARSAGVSFTVTSSDNTDTSVIQYVIIEP